MTMNTDSPETRRVSRNANLINPQGLILCNERYEILEPLGSGGMGTIYLARHLVLGSTVAVKFTHRSSISRASERFRREASLASQLQHPNLVRVLDYGEEPIPFLVMEYVCGSNLASILRGGRRLDTSRIVSLMTQICCGLQELHAHGIVHRDIKPANILLSPATSISGGRTELVKICDFGLAKLIDADAEREALTIQGEICGTMIYISPEQVLGDEPVDGRADVYACGVLLYQMATGALPFDANSHVGHLVKHANNPPKPPSEAYPNLSPRLEEIILKALSKDPDERQQSPYELCSELLELEPDAAENFRSLPWSVPDIPPPPPPAMKAKERAVDPDTRTYEKSTPNPSTPPPPAQLSGHTPPQLQAPPPQQQPQRSWGVLAIGAIAVLASVALLIVEKQAPPQRAAVKPNSFIRSPVHAGALVNPRGAGAAEAEAAIPETQPESARTPLDMGAAIASVHDADSAQHATGAAMAELPTTAAEAKPKKRKRSGSQREPKPHVQAPRTPPTLGKATVTTRPRLASDVDIDTVQYAGADRDKLERALQAETRQIEQCWRSLRGDGETRRLSLTVSFSSDGRAETLDMPDSSPLKRCIWSSLRYLRSDEPHHPLQLALTLR